MFLAIYMKFYVLSRRLARGVADTPNKKNQQFDLV